MMHPTNVSIRHTLSEWRVIACAIRVVQPELAAKITLARFTDPLADAESTLAITFTPTEHERLAIHVPMISWPPRDREDQSSGDVARTIADIDSFLGCSPEA
jgi:hypothetical protein